MIIHMCGFRAEVILSLSASGCSGGGSSGARGGRPTGQGIEKYREERSPASLSGRRMRSHHHLWGLWSCKGKVERIYFLGKLVGGGGRRGGVQCVRVFVRVVSAVGNSWAAGQRSRGRTQPGYRYRSVRYSTFCEPGC